MRYLLITYVRKANGQIDEVVTVSKQVRDQDVQTCNVILDYAQQRVVKCVIEGKKVDTDWPRLVAYYRDIYPEIDQQLSKTAGAAGK